MPEQEPTITMTEVTDPEEIARAEASRERFERNWAWLETNAKEVYSHRGKFICIAGQELFVADTVEELLAQSRAAHPEDDGRFTLYIPETRAARIYAH